MTTALGGGTGDQSGDGSQAGHFTEGFQSADIKAGIAAHNFENPEALGRAYMELEKKIGAKGVIRPGENASLEEVRQHMTEMGCPENAEGYDFSKLQAPGEGYQLDQELLGAMRDSAWHYGISQPQLEGLINDFQQYEHASHQKLLGEIKERAAQATEAIKQAWGEAYPAKIEAAQKAARQIFGEDAEQLQYLQGPDGKELGSNPQLLQVLAELGEKMAEHDMLTGTTPRLTRSVEEAKAELGAMMADPKQFKALMDSADPLHEEMVKKRNRLYEQIHGTASADAATQRGGVMVSTRDKLSRV